MSVIILLIAASILVTTVFLGAFIWSIGNRQFEDEFAASRRLLFDDHKSQKTECVAGRTASRRPNTTGETTEINP